MKKIFLCANIDTNKPKEAILKEAKNLARFGVSGIFLTSLDTIDSHKVADLASNIKIELPQIFLIASCGEIDAKYLKANGIDCCDFDGDSIKSAGLKLCSGMIFRGSQSVKEKIKLLKSQRERNSYIFSMRFEKDISRNEAIDCIILAREILSDSILLFGGDREMIFGENQKEIFTHGIDSLIVRSDGIMRDISMLQKYHLKIGHLSQDRQCKMI